MEEIGEQDAQSDQHHGESIDNDAFLSPGGVVSTAGDRKRKWKREKKNPLEKIVTEVVRRWGPSAGGW